MILSNKDLYPNLRSQKEIALSLRNKSDLTVVALGDSSVFGVGDHGQEIPSVGYGWTGRLAHDLQAKRFVNVAKNGAYENLTKPDLLKRINELLELRGLNDAFVDKQLELVITQNADFHAKVAAMREYNKLKKRTVEQIEFKNKRPFEDLTDEELAEAISDGIKFLKKK
jgi:hypothetical protein